MKLLRPMSTGVFALLAVPALAGEGMLGTKVDAAPTTAAAPVGVMPLIQMMVALALVVGLVKWVLPMFLGKVKTAKSGEIVVEATAPLGAGTVHIVSVRGRTLLIGSTSNGMSTLAELSEHDATFDESFARAAIEVPVAPEAVAATMPKPSDDVALALARLRRLEEQ